MTLPSWLVEFVPAWEEALRCVIAGATLTALWRAYCRPKRLPRRVVAAASMLITFVIAVPVVWARTHDYAETFANAMLIGILSPIVWEALIAAAVKWAPWLAEVLGESRCKPRDGECWTPERRHRELFGDTDKYQASDLEQWRKEHSKDD